MASTEVEMSDSDTGSTLSEALGTEPLDATSMVLETFQNVPDDEADRTWFSWSSKQFLKIDHAVNIRMGTPVSKIWQYGTEYRLGRQRGSRLFNKIGSDVGGKISIYIVHSGFSGQLYSFSLLPPLNQSDDAIRPGLAHGPAGGLGHVEKPTW